MINIRKTLNLVGTLSALLAFSIPASASSSIIYADPVPSTPGACDGGISYEWTAKMSNYHTLSFINHVGAKSFNEPPPAYEPPDTGWTHTSNWVAFELTKDAQVEIEVTRQEGVPYTSGSTIATARNKLVPAFAIFSGWDNTSCEEHRYNNAGNVDWSDIQYITNAPNKGGWSSVTRKIKLAAGKYSIVIGSTPKVLETYPDAATCDPATDATCYAYTGRHGYRVRIKTNPSRLESDNASTSGHSTN